ncbi:hypothetical protein JOC95_001415 [Bacillus tianshenii]|uniref:Integral membrane protein n=1 Tax=Sutcliffiella tianshenii TaxID=1463404 RepID=A0ABS2NY41_9BACI|nr:hypothetical protein [Bacillus tianshenii]MBM7619566.1 hypothetical protein [Bacillus tianshenii]
MAVEGLYFYFLSWVGWIIVTFFFSKSKQRLMVSVLLLLIIIGSNTFIPIMEFQISFSFIVLAFTAIILLVIVLKKNLLLHYFSICTVALAYVCFKLFEIYDPVWIIFDRTWMLSIILLYLGLMLFKSKSERFVFLLTGLLMGELLSSFVLHSVFRYSVVGSFEFLDVYALTLSGLSVWVFFETVTVYLDGFIQKRVKEKQG